MSACISVAHPKTRSGDISAVAGFLRAVRQHRWAPQLPLEADLYAGDHPRLESTSDSRAISEYVFAQLENPVNLAQLKDPRTRLIVEVLIRTGLRISDSCRLALDFLGREPQGAPYLRYRNHNMRREAMVPVDDELTDMITAQQTRVHERFPDTEVLFPRANANPDGRLPIPTATFNEHLQQRLATAGVTDEPGRPVKVTAHQFRHSYACRLINNEVPQEVVRRLLDHTSHAMTSLRHLTQEPAHARARTHPRTRIQQPSTTRSDRPTARSTPRHQPRHRFHRRHRPDPAG